jgi:MFS family permease
MKLEPQNEKLWSRDYIILTFAACGISFCNYFFNTTLPIYAQTISGTAAYGGLLIAAYTFAALAVRPFCGILSDRFGRTKLLIFGALVCAIACTLYHTAFFFILLILIRILHGFGFGIHSTSAGAAAGDIIPESRMSEGLGYFALSSTLAAAVAPGVALAIIGNGTVSEFQALFTIAAALSILSMIFDCFITYERKKQRSENNAPQTESPSDCKPDTPTSTFLGFESALYPPAAVNILLYISISAVTTYLSLYARHRNFGNVGIFFTVTSVGLFLSRLFLGKVADKRGVDIIIVPSLAVLAVSTALIPFADSLFHLYLLAFPFGIAQGAVGPAINTLMFNSCSPQRRGSASAMFFSSIDIGYGAGSILFGFVAEKLNYYFLYLGAAAFAAISLAVYLWNMSRREAKPA